MDFAIAQAAVMLLTPYLAKAGSAFAEKAGEAAWEAAQRVYRAVRAKFADDFVADGDSYPQQTLDRLAKDPENRARQQALADILKEKGQADPAFAAQLEDLVRSAAHNQSVNQFMTQVTGNAWVGTINNMGAPTAGRDVNISFGGSSPVDVVARASGGMKALLVIGLTLTFAGFVAFGSFVVRFILSIFTALASADPYATPDIPNPLPWLPLGIGLAVLGMIITAMSGLFTVFGHRGRSG